jgi:hypothetical protein
MQFLISNWVLFCIGFLFMFLMFYFVLYVRGKFGELSDKYEYLFDLIQDRDEKYDTVVSKVEFLESLFCNLDKYIADLGTKKITSKRKVSKIKDAK